MLADVGIPLWPVYCNGIFIGMVRAVDEDGAIRAMQERHQELVGAGEWPFRG